LVKERSEAKKRRNLLESELAVAGRTFSEIGKALAQLDAPNTVTLGAPDYALKEIDEAPEICSLGKVKDMLVELKNLRVRVSELDRRAAQLGVD
jgi:hypothetical protein